LGGTPLSLTIIEREGERWGKDGNGHDGRVKGIKNEKFLEGALVTAKGEGE